REKPAAPAAPPPPPQNPGPPPPPSTRLDIMTVSACAPYDRQSAQKAARPRNSCLLDCRLRCPGGRGRGPYTRACAAPTACLTACFLTIQPPFAQSLRTACAW